MLSAILPLLNTAWNIFLALMILNFMILVHEWGHFLAARWRGLKIEAFQIWFGKPIWKRTWNGVQYGLGWLPAGGFVKLPQMAPMDAIEGDPDQPRDPLPPISPLDKIIVAFAGPLFSFMLALVFAVLIWKVGRPIDEPANPTQIAYIDPSLPVAKSGLKVGDIIRAIDGKPVDRWLSQVNSVKWAIVSSENEQIVFSVDRDGQRLDIPVTPVLDSTVDEEANKPKGPVSRLVDFVFKRPPLRQVGIAGSMATLRIEEILPNSPAAEAGMRRGDVLAALNGTPLIHYRPLADQLKQHGTTPFTLTVTRDGKPVDLTITPRPPDKPKGSTKPEIGAAIGDPSLPTTYLHQPPMDQIRECLQGMKNLLVSIIAPKSDISITHMGGPVTIVNAYMLSLQSPEGWRLVLWFSAFLNINLAIMNMLPFPVLDGGHITMGIIEWIRRRPINVRVMEYVQSACVLLILCFFVTILFKDIGDVATRKSAEPIEFLPRGKS